MEPTPTKFVFFELDGTLFDMNHSMEHAISAVHKKYAVIAGTTVDELIVQNSVATEQVYNAYLHKMITYEEAGIQIAAIFFASFGLPPPSLDEVHEFNDTFETGYRATQRATPGSIETLVRLREHGYRIAIITNGRTVDQIANANAIGILHLVDHIITSEEAGYPKPDRRIFQHAIGQLGASLYTTYMIGSSVENDIKGALDAQLAAIMYCPAIRDSQAFLFGRQIPVLHHMVQLLDYLGIPRHRFEPRFASAPGQLVIEGMGIDLVTEPRSGLRVSKQRVHFLAARMAMALECAARKQHVPALLHIWTMIRAIERAAGPVDDTAIPILVAAPGPDVMITATHETRFIERDHSMRVEHVRFVLDTDSENEAALRAIASLLQGHCNYLMIGHPGRAIFQLRHAMSILTELAGTRQITYDS